MAKDRNMLRLMVWFCDQPEEIQKSIVQVIPKSGLRWIAWERDRETGAKLTAEYKAKSDEERKSLEFRKKRQEDSVKSRVEWEKQIDELRRRWVLENSKDRP
jgi:hypothetical protein